MILSSNTWQLEENYNEYISNRGGVGASGRWRVPVGGSNPLWRTGAFCHLIV